MQAVILAGGLGTRLRPLTSSVPKSMVRVHGRPFLEYELALLAQHGVSDVVLCVGYLGEQIVQHFGSGRTSQRLQYSWDGDQLLGPIGALKNAEPLLEDSFFVLYGDAYPRLDYAALMECLLSSGGLGAMAVLHNRHEHGPSDVRVEDGIVVEFDKTQFRPELEWINFGVSALRRQALQLVEPHHVCEEETFYRRLIAHRQLAAFEVAAGTCEIGSFPGLAEFGRLIAQTRVGTGSAGSQPRAQNTGVLASQDPQRG